jgi:xanthine/uracil permease
VNKTHWLDAAEVFDSWRVVPRVILFAYGGWLAYITDRLLNWYMTLPQAAQSVQASGFCLGAITAITTIAGWVYKIYANTGREWENQSSMRTSSTTTEVVK